MRCEILRSMLPESVCQSVCLSRDFTALTRLNGSRSCLCGDSWGPKKHWYPDFPTDSMRPSQNYFGHLLQILYRGLDNNSVLLYPSIYALLGCIECVGYCYRCSRCLSVTPVISTLLCKNGRTHQDDVWSEHSWGPMEHCVRRGSWCPYREEKGGPLLKFGTPSYLHNSWSYIIESSCAYRWLGALTKTTQRQVICQCAFGSRDLLLLLRSPIS